MHPQHHMIIGHITALGIILACFSTNAYARHTNTHDQPLAAQWLYNGINRPAMIRIDPEIVDNNRPTLQLALLADDGTMIALAGAVRPGLVDLAEIMPEIWELQKAAYLQCLLDDDEPVGASLVVQPMLSRMVPVTEQATRPGGGASYTKIIGWRSAADREATRSRDTNEARDDADSQQPAEESKPAPRRVMTGVRMYLDEDISMETTHGTMRFAMRPDAAPNTVWNFRQLCAGGFYRDVIFHRIVPLDRQGLPFVIQAGDPSATGEGNAGYWLPIEPSDLAHDFGVISMARSNDPDSAGTQFFVCLSREGTARLDVQYCAFGELVDGAETLNAIANVELADVRRGRPADPPVITSTSLEPASPRKPGVGRLDMHRAQEKTRTPPGQPGRVDR